VFLISSRDEAMGRTFVRGSPGYRRSGPVLRVPDLGPPDETSRSSEVGPTF
jgi:hypothetical protein